MPETQVTITMNVSDLYDVLASSVAPAKRVLIKTHMAMLRAHLGLPASDILYPSERPKKLGRPKTGGADDRSWVICTPSGDTWPATLAEVQKVLKINESTARVRTSKDKIYERYMENERWTLHRDKSLTDTPQKPSLAQYLESLTPAGRARRF